MTNDQLLLAFEFAGNLSRDLITLTAGILAFSITFTKAIRNPTRGLVGMVATSWTLYALSILAGFWALMALTGTLGESAPVTTLYGNSTLPSGIQILLFGCATVLFTSSGVLALVKMRGEEPAGGAVAAEAQPPEASPALRPAPSAAPQAVPTPGGKRRNPRNGSRRRR